MNWKILSKLLKKDIVNDSMAYTSYLAFVKNNNADEVDAALGKGNEDFIHGVGESLSRYKKFLDNSIDINTTFSELKKCDNLLDIGHNPIALDQLLKDNDLLNFIRNSKYSIDKIMIDRPDEIVLFDNGVSNYLDLNAASLSSTVTGSSGSLSINSSINISISTSVRNTTVFGVSASIPFLSEYALDTLFFLGYKYIHVTLSGKIGAMGSNFFANFFSMNFNGMGSFSPEFQIFPVLLI